MKDHFGTWVVVAFCTLMFIACAAFGQLPEPTGVVVPTPAVAELPTPHVDCEPARSDPRMICCFEVRWTRFGGETRAERRVIDCDPVGGR